MYEQSAVVVQSTGSGVNLVCLLITEMNKRREQIPSTGLPCVAPTVERVDTMLTGTTRDRLELLGSCPPCYGEVTVEKV